MNRFLVALLFLGCMTNVVSAEEPLAAATIVVFNSSNPESVELAKFYAEKRGIARNHLVGFACSGDEEISRDDYDRTTVGSPSGELSRNVHHFRFAKVSRRGSRIVRS